jgi:PAS domain S-box-containing protein
MEDDPGVARLLERRLERMGYHLTIARNGEEGLQLYGQNHYDILLIDHVLPVYDGLEVIRRLNGRNPAPPMIMLTGSGNETIAVEAMKLGASDYIVKDVSMTYIDLLPAIIDRVLKQQKLLEEKIRIEEALRRSERHFRSLIENSSDIIALHNADGTVAYISPSIRRVLGHAPEDLIGKPCNHYVQHDETGVRLIRQIAKAQKGTILTGELKALHVDGSTRILDVTAQNLIDDSDIGGIVVNARDITERKQMEQERERLISELNAFAHTVAHDLRSPLGTVQGFVDLLMESWQTLSGDKIQAYLSAVGESADHALNIIQEMLLLASVRKDDVKLQPLDMEAIVNKTMQRMTYKADHENVEFVVQEDWPVVLGYGPWVEEVWANYISNAIKYGGDPPHIEIGCRTQDDGFACLWVEDNGEGISPERRAELFKPFSRLEFHRAEGYGLGLSIVHRIIVEKLGGEVGVREGASGRGSRFYFTLPLLQDGNAP